MIANSETISYDLAGQVAVVTGGGRGLGRAFAVALASAGAKIAVMARSGEQLAESVSEIQAQGGRGVSFVVDVTDRRAVENAMKRVEKKLGPVDLLVNNAGVMGPVGPLWETDPDEWWRCIEVNLRGALLSMYAVLPSMIERRQGRIINIASVAGTQAISFLSAYSTSKTALLRLTENLAAELNGTGVKVFTISPGTVRTPSTDQSLQSPEVQTWLPWFSKIFEDKLDLPPDRPVQLLLQIASGKADALSGRFINVYFDLDQMVTQLEKATDSELYALRLRRLES